MSEWPIFVLTLPGDDDRRQPLLDALGSAGLSYQLFMGVDGRSGLPGEFEALVDRQAALARLGRSMCDGELACALSHRQIYAHILEAGLPGAIILEDDAILQPGFADFLRAGDYKRVPMLLFDYSFGRALPLLRIRVSHGEFRRAACQFSTANAYSLSVGVAEQLYRASTPVSVPADWPASLYELEAWLMVPRLVRHITPGTGGASHLQEKRMELVNTLPEKYNPRRTLVERIRRRISVRVGRAKGER